jgi:beta-hydroxylase
MALTFKKFIQDPRRGAIKLLKQKARPALNRVLVRYSEVGDPPTFEPELFPFAADLEASWRTIRQEVEAVLSHRAAIPPFQEVSPDQRRISQDESWRTFWLRGFGVVSSLGRAICPRTNELLDAIPDVETALFSILEPGKHIPPHRGVYKGIINYHLGLIVPRAREQCRMRVGEKILHWEEGKSVIFDDTNPHEVWNESDEDRVVLMVQFRRPMRAPGDQLSRLFLHALRMTPFVTRAYENQARWEQRFVEAIETRQTRGQRPPPGGRDTAGAPTGAR